MQDTMLYDGDQQRYLQLLANGDEEEVGIDASDVDSSDVASSNDIDSSDDDSDTGGGSSAKRDKLSSSVARSAGRGKRGRAAIGASASDEAASASLDPNPLMAEIGSKTERRQAAAQRWFSDPMFADVDETLAAEEENKEEDGEEGDDEANKPLTKRARRGGGGDETGKRRRKGAASGEDAGELTKKDIGAAEALMAEMPKTDKEKRKEKRKKVSIDIGVFDVKISAMLEPEATSALFTLFERFLS